MFAEHLLVQGFTYATVGSTGCKYVSQFCGSPWIALETRTGLKLPPMIGMLTKIKRQVLGAEGRKEGLCQQEWPQGPRRVRSCDLVGQLQAGA